MGRSDIAIELVALDLDWTLTRGETVSEAIARSIGRFERMRELEASDTDRAATKQLREEVAEWFRGHSIQALSEPLPAMNLAPGTRDAFQRFRDNGVQTAIVSLTWEFAVEWFAEELGADYHVGTTFHPADGITDHFWAADKPDWIRELATDRGIDMARVAGVGDSYRDFEMLDACGQAYYVGETLPAELSGAHHLPDENMDAIADHILGPPDEA